MTSLLIHLISTLLIAQPNARYSNSVIEPPQFPTKKIMESGVNQGAWKNAFAYHSAFWQSKKLSKEVLAIADFSKPSNKKRLFIVNLKNGSVAKYKVAHGKGSDKDHNLLLEKFSGQPGSYATPKGFHRMTATYHGRHGLSLKMQGLEKSNKSSEARAIVLHGAEYVSWKHTGRSLGCPAVEKKHAKIIIDQLKNGALFYHYK